MIFTDHHIYKFINFLDTTRNLVSILISLVKVSNTNLHKRSDIYNANQQQPRPGLRSSFFNPCFRVVVASFATSASDHHLKARLREMRLSSMHACSSTICMQIRSGRQELLAASCCMLILLPFFSVSMPSTWFLFRFSIASLDQQDLSSWYMHASGSPSKDSQYY